MEKFKEFFLQNKNLKQIVIKNIFWLSSGTILSKIIRSAMIIYAARILGASQYGVFSYALSFGAIFSIFADVGLTGILTRELVKRENKKEYLATALALKTALVVLTTALIAFISPLFAGIEEVKPLMFAIAGILAFDSIRTFLFSIVRSENKMETESLSEIVTEFLITGIGLSILFFAPSVKNLIYGYFLAGGFSLVFLIFLLRKKIFGIFIYFNKKLLPEIISSISPFVFTSLLGMMMTNIDPVIIGAMKDAKAVGVLSAAQKPISLFHMIPTFFYTALLPLLSKLSEDKKEKNFALVVEKSSLISLGLALPIVAGGMLVALPVINVVYGAEYLGAVLPFKILLLSLLPIFPGVVFSGALLSENKQKVFLKSGLAGAVLNVGLNFLLIPKYGIIGSAFATVISQTIANAIFFFEINKKYNIKIWNGIGKMILATIIMSIFVFWGVKISLPLVIIFGLAFVIYFGSLFLMKEKLLREI